MAQYEFDVALTFAGEDRTYAGSVANTLRARGVRVFYDQYEQATLWGEDLVVYLDNIYRRKSRFVVLFGSVNYVKKVWTSHERRSAQARAIEERGDAYLLPVRLDDTEIPGLPSTISFLDGRIFQPTQVAGFLLQKLGIPDTATSEVRERDFMAVPLTAVELQAVATQRPDGWEYLLLAGGVWQAVKAHEQKALDYELGYAASSGVHVVEDKLSHFIAVKLDALSRLVNQIMIVISPESQEWALGKPGEPGDPNRIAHLCDRFGAVYEGILDWASDIRGTSCSEEYRKLLSLLAKFAGASVSEIQRFADRFIVEIQRLPSYLASDDPDKGLLDITLALSISISDDVVNEFATERNRLHV